MAEKNAPKVSKREVENYFDIYRKKGYSVKSLSHFLEKKGYPPELIEGAAREYQRGRKLVYLYLSLVVLITIISISIYITITAPPEVTADCGFNKNCLFKFANDCRNAVYHQEEKGSIVRYEVNNCFLSISFEKFAPHEPEEVADFLRGKAMSCPYERNNFDLSWLDSFITATQFCEGSLKNSLFAVRIGQLTLG